MRDVIKTVQRGDLYVVWSKEPEHMDIADAFDDKCHDIGRLRKQVASGEMEWFCLRVDVETGDDQVLASNFLGGCMYRKASQAIRGNGDLAREALREARAKVKALDAKRFDEFFTAYLECALWSSTDEDMTPLDQDFSVDDITRSARSALRRECLDFWGMIRNLLPTYFARGQTACQAGHDFWLTRNGHGAGFWDRGLGALGDKLTDAAKTFGSCDLYVTKRKKIAV